ncbi:HAMP domain-containing sensor histidine kinase [Streptomyces sp. NPDC048270]|uniref:sensor histidine kinase n=1 Tax=Streptomyces sp. NPDC048270 TaxID=3154615 RepID=UPI0033F2DC3B
MKALARFWPASLRLQLTLLFGTIFFIAATAVLAVTMVLVDNSLRYALTLAFDETCKDAAQLQSLPAPLHGGNDTTKQVIAASMQQNLLLKGAVTVLVVGAVAVTAAWFVSGRLLRPLQAISSTASAIAGRTLHRRIALRARPGEIKILADSFDNMLDRLDQAFAGQERFIANAAHELKTPIAVNRTLVEVAMNRRGAPPEVLLLGENLLSVCMRHERLIDALLTLARATDTVTERRQLDLADLARNALVGTADEAAARSIDIDAVLAPAPATGDPVLLEQAVRNLVDNAVRYNITGGALKVRTAQGLHGASVMVSNTGPEIADHEVPGLFMPFRRLTDRVGSTRGSGLGLSIVRAVAQAHGGEVAARPRPGGGLDTEMTVPQRTASVASGNELRDQL